MCYKKPGPRCSNNAARNLELAKTACADSPTLENILRIREAENEYFLTPRGIADLKAKKEAATTEQGRADYDHLIQHYQDKRDELVSLSTMDISQPGQEGARNQLEFHQPIEGLPEDMHLSSIAPVEQFNEEIKNGYIRTRAHNDPDVPYTVLDYTESTTYESHWNEATMNSRGLIINTDTGEIVARPFQKFFNDGEDNEYNRFPRQGAVVVSNKEDGSMGTLYTLPDGKPAIATRGSMNSEQSDHATQLYRERYHGQWEPDESRTYLYEVIYPANRVVLDYEGQDDIVLIGAVEKNTGRTIPLNEITEWKGRKADILEFSSYEEALATPVPDNKEGYVVHFTESDQRVKLKGENYLRLHKIMTGLTKNALWENMALGNGKLSDDYKRGVPEEFRASMESYENELQEKYDKLLNGLKESGASAKERFGISRSTPLTEVPHEQKKKVAAYIFSKHPKEEANRILFLMNRDSTRELSPRFRQKLYRDFKPFGKQVL